MCYVLFLFSGALDKLIKVSDFLYPRRFKKEYYVVKWLDVNEN